MLSEVETFAIPQIAFDFAQADSPILQTFLVFRHCYFRRKNRLVASVPSLRLTFSR